MTLSTFKELDLDYTGVIIAACLIPSQYTLTAILEPSKKLNVMQIIFFHHSKNIWGFEGPTQPHPGWIDYYFFNIITEVIKQIWRRTEYNNCGWYLMGADWPLWKNDIIRHFSPQNDMLTWKCQNLPVWLECYRVTSWLCHLDITTERALSLIFSPVATCGIAAECENVLPNPGSYLKFKSFWCLNLNKVM